MNTPHANRMAARRGPAGRGAPPSWHTRGRLAACAVFVAAIGVAGAATGPAALAATSAVSAASAAAGQTAALAGLPPQGDITWSVSPANAIAPDQRTTFNYLNIKPGSTITDHFAVLNRGTQSAAFELYAADATGTTASNVLIIAPDTAAPKDIGSWVYFPHHASRVSIIIPPGKGIIETFTVVVPQNASPGDHTGAILAQVGFQRTSGNGHQVTLAQRIGVPLYVRVYGPVHAGLSVDSISASFHGPLSPFGDGSATVSYTVHNTGNIRLSGSQLVTVSGPFNISAQVNLKALPTVLPGDSVRLTADAKDLYPAGPFTAHVQLGPAPAPGAVPLAVPLGYVRGSASLFAVPWSLILSILLLAAIIVGAIQSRRWRRRRLVETLNAVADHARRETERRLLGSRKTAAKTQGSS
jgi:hypothetical protein